MSQSPLQRLGSGASASAESLRQQGSACRRVNFPGLKAGAFSRSCCAGPLAGYRHNAIPGLAAQDSCWMSGLTHSPQGLLEGGFVSGNLPLLRDQSGSKRSGAAGRRRKPRPLGRGTKIGAKRLPCCRRACPERAGSGRRVEWAVRATRNERSRVAPPQYLRTLARHRVLPQTKTAQSPAHQGFSLLPLHPGGATPLFETTVRFPGFARGRQALEGNTQKVLPSILRRINNLILRR